ncbi:MAG TPA: glycosyl hydrolase, partial [Vicinamibacteria bacterium]|nr:glycosyl hydrolase [Vicinamibacteria bacterium]
MHIHHSRSLALKAALMAALVLSPALLTAQPPAAARPGAQAGPFGALRWRSLGPLRGGRSIAAAGSVARPNEYYFGATGGGLWKTTDGGTTWRPVTDGQISSASVGAAAVAPSNP